MIAIYLSTFEMQQIGQNIMTKNQSQAEKFKEAARKHEADEDETAWGKRLRQVVKPKPVEKPA